jgi:hypothetical protein
MVNEINKSRKVGKLFIISLIAVVLCLTFILSAPQINLLSPPSTPWITPNNSQNFSWNINIDAGDTLYNITDSFNGTNYTIFDKSSWVLGMNFNNLSALGENTNGSTEATCGLVYDISGSGNNGTVIGCNSTVGFVAENISWGSNMVNMMGLLSLVGIKQV